MKLLDKIKNAIFEEEEFDEEFASSSESVKEEEEPKKAEVKTAVSDIVKKIDIEKTIPKNLEIKKEVPIEEVKTEEKPIMKREMRRTPVIFDENDFVEAPKREIRREPVVVKEEVKKPLYGGYKDEKAKEKFKPSPIISPVYGFVGVSPVLEHARVDDLAEKHIFIQNKKEEISLDAVRQKAFGEREDTFIEDDDLGLLYEMKKEDTPAISKITLGDAEEYFEDLGLEYNVDYRDESRKKQASKSTRSTKNKELSERIDNEIFKELESTRELEITKEQLKPKTAKEIKKVKKIDDIDLGMTDDKDEADEKNLYDLIDMMYDSK